MTFIYICCLQNKNALFTDTKSKLKKIIIEKVHIMYNLQLPT